MHTNQNLSLRELISLADTTAQELNYTPESLRKMKTTWWRFERYSMQHRCSIFDEQIAATFLMDNYNYPDQATTRHSSYVNGVANAIRKLSDLRIHGRFLPRAKAPLPDIAVGFIHSLDAYVAHCRQRRIVEGSIRTHQKNLIRFFEFLIVNGINKPEQITASSISQYASSLTGYSMKTAEGILFVIRSYLKTTYFASLISINLSEAIPKLHYPKSDNIPVAWEAENVNNLLSSVDRGSPLGKRDYALLQIVIKLGLRDGDVRNLKFEDIKWNANRIEFIQAKTMQPQSLPLLPDVGNALVDYLKNGRPESSSPYIFVKHQAPYDEIRKAGNIVTKYLRFSKISVPVDRGHGIHSLRHSLANRLLSQEVPVDVISQILGHVSSNSAKAYLHLDIQSLRKCALEVGEIND